MRHVLVMTLFAALVGLVFGIIGRDDMKSRTLYGLKIFAEFFLVGMGLAWLLYWIPGYKMADSRPIK